MENKKQLRKDAIIGIIALHKLDSETTMEDVVDTIEYMFEHSTDQPSTKVPINDIYIKEDVIKLLIILMRISSVNDVIHKTRGINFLSCAQHIIKHFNQIRDIDINEVDLIKFKKAITNP